VVEAACTARTMPTTLSQRCRAAVHRASGAMFRHAAFYRSNRQPSTPASATRFSGIASVEAVLLHAVRSATQQFVEDMTYDGLKHLTRPRTGR